MVVVQSDERGDIEQRIRVITSRPSVVRSARCTVEGLGVRVEMPEQRFSRENSVMVSVPSCGEKCLDCNINFDLCIAINEKEHHDHMLTVPIYRFPEKGVSK